MQEDTGNPVQDSESEKEGPKKLSLSLNRFVRNCTSKFRKDILFDSPQGIGIVHFENFSVN